MELGNAIYLVVRDGHSVPLVDCFSAALDLLGFKRLTRSTRERLEGICSMMIGEGWLRQSADRLQLGEASDDYDVSLLK